MSKLEILMLKRNSRLNWAGEYVFPGGIVDPQDYTVYNKSNTEFLNAARVAALRQTYEQSGIFFIKETDYKRALDYFSSPKTDLKDFYKAFNFFNRDLMNDEMKPFLRLITPSPIP